MQGKSYYQEILRFATAGDVDDGKSTLIGRLLHDSENLFEDQMTSVKKASHRKGMDTIDLAMFTDGLKEEREQAITIDVAYRYFNTAKKKYILADTPGHLEYTRNMITGASTADAVVLLVDARNGVVEQTKRHTFIANLLGVEHLIVCVNKMDLVAYQAIIFNQIKDEFEDVLKSLKSNQQTHFIPISALQGDNVVEFSSKMTWYDGLSLLDLLDSLEVNKNQQLNAVRFPIQTIIRPQKDSFRDFRGYAGRLVNGQVQKGDEVMIWPSGIKTRIKSISFYNKEFQQVRSPRSVTIQLEDDIDAGRGSLIASVTNPPMLLKELEVMVCWLSDQPAVLNKKYSLQQTVNTQLAIIKNIIYHIDIDTFKIIEEKKRSLKKNNFARIKIKLGGEIVADIYQNNKSTGGIILIDNATNETVAAGMIVD